MLEIGEIAISGFEPAIHSMRNPMNSWNKSDSESCYEKEDCSVCEFYNTDSCNLMSYNYSNIIIGPNDLDLAMRLAKSGPTDGKYRRMIMVYMDITGPLYWWKEFDTYKVGTVANSCSTMHKIHAKEFTLDDFSTEHLEEDSKSNLEKTIELMNSYREKFLETKDKKYWWQMIQLLPTSYNQKRTVMLNYEVLANIYNSRRNHKLDEWHTLCDYIEILPYSELITLEKKEEN